MCMMRSTLAMLRMPSSRPKKPRADVVVNAEGQPRFLLLQSYMPAQEVHVLKNPKSEDGSPWYGIDFGPQLVTPEWSFARTALRRWP